MGTNATIIFVVKTFHIMVFQVSIPIFSLPTRAVINLAKYTFAVRSCSIEPRRKLVAFLGSGVDATEQRIQGLSLEGQRKL